MVWQAKLLRGGTMPKCKAVKNVYALSKASSIIILILVKGEIRPLVVLLGMGPRNPMPSN